MVPLLRQCGGLAEIPRVFDCDLVAQPRAFLRERQLLGFLLPLNGFTPAVGVAILSFLVLAVAGLARYTYNLQGAWRPAYVLGATIALYFNVFVLVVQLFQKVARLQARVRVKR